MAKLVNAAAFSTTINLLMSQGLISSAAEGLAYAGTAAASPHPILNECLLQNTRAYFNSVEREQTGHARYIPEEKKFIQNTGRYSTNPFSCHFQQH